MSGLLGGLIDACNSVLERHRQAPFLRATMAASALIAIADGSVSFRERMRVDQVLETIDQLKVFDPHEAVNLFNDYVDDIKSDPKHGREKALDAILIYKGDTKTAELLVRVCLAISRVDGGIPMVDQIEIVTLCTLLEIEPHDCGLYVNVPPEQFLG